MWGGIFYRRTCNVEFRIAGLLSISAILARPRSLALDACLISERRKTVCRLRPAKNLSSVNVIRPRRPMDEVSA
jgi:hypothetical protein